eukprot:gb/GFBE01038361.1/.p1 GENE.gb/GFBE01038361.1/~~gb/GFBE01038361.1/.p1  ORF type:complete len:293 (+),score=60.90 gb/GFBE01038361.1/:1-879(+)
MPKAFPTASLTMRPRAAVMPLSRLCALAPLLLTVGLSQHSAASEEVSEALAEASTPEDCSESLQLLQRSSARSSSRLATIEDVATSEDKVYQSGPSVGEFCCFSSASTADACGSCYSNAVAAKGEFYHNSSYCTQSAETCTTCSGVWCGAKEKTLTAEERASLEDDVTEAKDEVCTRADAEIIQGAGFDDSPRSAPSLAINCTYHSWGTWETLEEDKFVECMSPLTRGCARCFMKLGSRRFSECKQVCLYREWCEKDCLSCLRGVKPQLQECIGSEFVIPELKECAVEGHSL